jgi:hypothetical protein
MITSLPGAFLCAIRAEYQKLRDQGEGCAGIHCVEWQFGNDLVGAELPSED